MPRIRPSHALTPQESRVRCTVRVQLRRGHAPRGQAGRVGMSAEKGLAAITEAAEEQRL